MLRNSLSLSVRSSPSLNFFKARLKAFPFSKAFLPLYPLRWLSISFSADWAYLILHPIRLSVKCFEQRLLDIALYEKAKARVTLSIVHNRTLLTGSPCHYYRTVIRLKRSPDIDSI